MDHQEQSSPNPKEEVVISDPKPNTLIKDVLLMTGSLAGVFGLLGLVFIGTIL